MSQNEPHSDTKLQRAGWYAAFGLIPFGDSLLALLILLVERIRRFFVHGQESQTRLSAPSLARWSYRLLYAFIFSALISSAFSTKPGVAFRSDLGLLFMLVSLFHSAVCLGRGGSESLRRRYLPVMVFAGMAACAVALIRYGVIHYFLHVREYRAVNLFTGFNALGTTLIFVGGLGLTYLIWRGGKWRRLILPFLGLVCLTLLVTRSRGAWFGFAGMLGTLCLFSRKYLIILLVVAVIAALFFSVSPLLQERLKQALSIQTDPRVKIWKTTLNMIRANPIVGIGTGVYPYVFRKYAVDDLKSKICDMTPFAHNIFLNAFAEFGLIGLIVFSAFLLTVFFMGLTLARTGDPVYQGIFAVLVGIVIHQQVDCTILGLNLGGMFWMLLGLVIGLYTYERTQGTRRPQQTDSLPVA